VAAQSEYLVFIDGDCLLEPHFLEEHYTSRKRGEVVTGRRVLLTKKTTERLLVSKLNAHSFGCKLFFQLLAETLFGHQKTQMEQMIRLPRWMRKLFIRERKRYILGCNFSLYKEDLLAVNGFDERFQYPGYGEDIDLEFRLARNGVPAMSRKCQLVQFHCYHTHFDTNYAPNKQLLQENTDNNITFTPSGIQR
jgi:GT2 family glycosyltransferase